MQWGTKVGHGVKKSLKTGRAASKCGEPVPGPLPSWGTPRSSRSIAASLPVNTVVTANMAEVQMDEMVRVHLRYVRVVDIKMVEIADVLKI